MPTHCVVYGASACSFQEICSQLEPYDNDLGIQQHKDYTTYPGHGSRTTSIIQKPHTPRRSFPRFLLPLPITNDTLFVRGLVIVIVLDPLDTDEISSLLDPLHNLSGGSLMLRVVVGGLVAARRAQGKRRQVSSTLKANKVGSKTGKKDKKKRYVSIYARWARAGP